MTNSKPTLPPPSPLLPSPALWLRQPPDLPSEPGIYWYVGAQGEVLYVGKAKNLKNRLKSYSRLNLLLPRTRQLVKEAKGVRYQIVATEFLALITEAELIRSHQPSYNIRLKDDKSPLYIILTKDRLPRLLTIHRQALSANPGSTYKAVFGPYSSAYQVNLLLKTIRRIFPYCTQTPTQARKHQACFYSHLRLCPGVCRGLISLDDYKKQLNNITLLLRGKSNILIDDLTEQIKACSQNQNFEACIPLRNQLEAVLYLTKRQPTKNVDIELPNLIEDEQDARIFGLSALLTKYQSLPKNYILRRIECYDISNIMGDHATASMVVFNNGLPDKSNYRHFKIKTVLGPNDVAMLKEVVKRRQKHPEWGIPQLIIIDGGIGQVTAVQSVLNWTIPIVGIAKRPDRLIIPTKKSTAVSFIKVPLDPTTPLSRLVQSIRNEAHRFAKTYTLKLHTKSFSR